MLTDDERRVSVVENLDEEFALEQHVLQRIVGIAGAHMPDSRQEYVVTYARRARQTLFELSSVLDLDNVRNDPIESLNVVFRAEGADKPVSTVDVSFKGGGEFERGTRIRVSGRDIVSVRTLSAELTEQAERAIVKGPGMRAARTINRNPMIPVVVIPFFLTLYIAAFGRNTDLREWRDSAAVIRQQIDSASTAESRIAALARAASFQLDGVATPRERTMDWSSLLAPRALAVAVTGALLFGLLAHILVVCYPSAVFVWGDGGRYYHALVARRSKLWWFALVTIPVGIVLSWVSAAFFS